MFLGGRGPYTHVPYYTCTHHLAFSLYTTLSLHTAFPLIHPTPHHAHHLQFTSHYTHGHRTHSYSFLTPYSCHPHFSTLYIHEAHSSSKPSIWQKVKSAQASSFPCQAARVVNSFSSRIKATGYWRFLRGLLVRHESVWCTLWIDAL